jgi:hypothetical protein
MPDTACSSGDFLDWTGSSDVPVCCDPAVALQLGMELELGLGWYFLSHLQLDFD